jgi:soluble lytic murein transglycosylase
MGSDEIDKHPCPAASGGRFFLSGARRRILLLPMLRSARIASTITSTAVLAILMAGCAGRTQSSAAQATGSAAGLPGVAQTAQEEARAGDPVAAKLAVWLRAQIQGAASASEIDTFLHDNPDWPGRAVLNQRLQQALAVEPDDSVARNLCLQHRPDTTPSLLRCAAALSATPAGPGLLPPAGAAPRQSLSLSRSSLPPAIASAAEAAWVGGIDDPAHEAEFLRLFGQVPTPADQWRRFDRQEWSGAIAAAARQIRRLSPADMPLAAARLELRRGDAGADGLAAALHGAPSRDPALLLDFARWLRRHERFDEALALWRDRALAAERAIPSPRRPAFWTERDALAREMLSQHRDNDALYLAEDTVQTDSSAHLDSEFLTGWIQLRRLNDAVDAAPHFAGLTQESRSVITTSRGFYWLGRALDAQGLSADARRAYAQAAQRPTSFYGQAATRLLFAGNNQVLAEAIARQRDPQWTRSDAIRFAGLELARAATLLVSWNDARQARGFLLRQDELSGSDSEHALGANFADRLGLPDVAVAIARSAGRHGLVLAQSGWPTPYLPPAEPGLPRGLALAIMRQESSFDPEIVSPAGAHGLMQLMPATARLVSAGRGDVGALSDPATNVALGTSYLASLLSRFGGTVTYAVAAYNAGPNHVQQWLQQNGDPSAQATSVMIDWIELIPFGETRNYVQRVMENQTIYRSRTPPGNAATYAWSGPRP